MRSSTLLAIALCGFVCCVHTKTIPSYSQNELTPLQLSPVDPSLPESRDKLTQHRREFIAEMGRDAWLSIGKSSTAELRNAVAAMSTLWVMGLKEEFNRAKQLIETELRVSGRESVAKGLKENGAGALLSAYVLSGDETLLGRAQEIAELYRIPVLKEKNLLEIMESWIDHRMEFRYLSDLTGDREPWGQLAELDSFVGRVGAGAKVLETDAINLMVQLKSYLQSNRQNKTAIQNYYQTIKALEQTGYIYTSPKFPLSQIKTGPQESMNLWHCLFGSMLSLGAQEMPNVLANSREAKDHWDLAERITETCHLAANSTKSKLPFSGFKINNQAVDSRHAVEGWGGYNLEPALAESYFVLYRQTGDPKYREYAWELAEAIFNNARVSKALGYAQVAKSDVKPTTKVTPYVQAPEFLSGTLKYLYLTFAPETYLPLDEWVFNVAGHPLPICGKNRAYPKGRCSV